MRNKKSILPIISAFDGIYKSNEDKMSEYNKQLALQAENNLKQGLKLRAYLDDEEYDELTASKMAKLYGSFIAKTKENKVPEITSKKLEIELNDERRNRQNEMQNMGMEDKPMLKSYEYDIDDYNKKDIENYMRGNTPFGTFQGIKNKHGVQNLNKDLLFKYALENNLLQYIKKKN